MLIFREASEILRDVNFLYCNKRCLCFNALQHHFCLIAERAVRFRVELKLNWETHILEFSTSRQKSHSFFP